MKNAKLLVIALLVALLACLAVTAMADECPSGGYHVIDFTKPSTTILYPHCTTEGSIQYYCSKCGGIFYQNVPSLGGHQRSGIFVSSNASAAPCEDQVLYECCVNYGKKDANGVLICNHLFTDNSQVKPGDPSKHDWVKIGEELKPTCTKDGVEAAKKCTVCGKVVPGKVVKATGHDFGTNPWENKTSATCASTGLSQRKCTKCDYYETKVEPKLTYHVKVNADKTLTPITNVDFIALRPERPATCTEDGCKAIYICPTCGAHDPNRDGQLIPKTGHHMVVDTNSQVLPTCTTPGMTILYCDNAPDLGNGPVKCGHMQVINAPAIGHSATWIPVANNGIYTTYALRCGKCGTDLATQLVKAGDKAPSGTVNTAKQNADLAYEAQPTTLKETAKTTTTKKTSTKTATAKKTTTTAAAAPAPAATTTVAAAEEGTALVEGINTLEEKAVVIVKDGKATLVYVEDGFAVVIGETTLELNVAADIDLATALAKVEAAPVEAASK